MSTTTHKVSLPAILCIWLRSISSGLYRPAADAADLIEHQATRIAELEATLAQQVPADLPPLVGTLASLPPHQQSVIRAYGDACARVGAQQVPAVPERWRKTLEALLPMAEESLTRPNLDPVILDARGLLAAAPLPAPTQEQP